MNNFLDTHKVPKLNQDQINDLNNPISNKEIEAVINSLPTKNKTKQQTKEQITQGQMYLVQRSIRSSKKT